MICPICNSENRPGAKFCDECGARLLSEQVAIDHMEEAFGTEDELEQRFGQFSLSSYEASSEVEPDGPFDSDSEEIASDFEYPAYPEDLYDAEDSFHKDFGPSANPILADTTNGTKDDQPINSSASQTAVISKAAPVTSADATVDLKALRQAKEQDEAYAGLDQSNYDEMPIVTPWDKGGTMKMKPIEATDDKKLSKAHKFVSSKEDTAQEKSKKPLIIVLALLVLAAAIAACTWYFELWGGYKIPDVVNLTSQQASQMLQEKGFTVRIEKVKSDDIEGTVLLTDPNAGSRLAQGGEVVIHIAVPREVPAVVGLTEEQAKAKIQTEGFTNVTYQKKKSNEEEGTVLEITPEPGTKQKGAYPITIVVAEPYRVPDVAGLSKDEAISLLEEEGYRVAFQRVYSEEKPEGQVVSSSPEAGEKLNSGETVTISVTVSRKTELLEATANSFYSGATFVVEGGNYVIDSLTSSSYAGGDTTTVQVVARAYAIVPGINLYIYSSPDTYTWNVEWSQDNEIVSLYRA